MEEKTVTMMEGVAREWRVRVKDSAGNVLNPEGFSFYGAAADGVQVPRRMRVHVEGDVAVLLLPGLWMSGRCWRYQVLCQDVLTGVEWVLCQGDVVLERRVACNGPALHEDAVLVDAVLDSELDQVEVFLGDSTAASAEAARLAVAAREGAEAGAARSVDAAAKAEALKGVALDAAAKAALSAEGAGESAQEAGDAAAEAAGCARDAEAKAAEAEASREAAEAAAKKADARAAEAEAGAKVSAEAVSDALAARDEAAAARGGAEDAMREAGARAGEAEDFAEAAEAARGGAAAAQVKAETAQAEAEAARVNAEAAAGNAAASAEVAENSVDAAEWALPADYMRFSHVTSFTELGECATDLLDTEVWKYPLKSLTNSIGCMMEQIFPNLRKVLFFSEALNGVVWPSEGRFINKGLDEIRIILPNAQNLQYFAGNASYKGKVSKILLYAPQAGYMSGYFINSFRCSGEVWILTGAESVGEWSVGGGTMKIIRYLGNKIKTISLACEQKLEEIHCGFPLATSINFQKAKLDKASVLRVVNSLQAYDAAAMTAVPTLTLGIDPALNGDEEINAALLNLQEAVEDGGKGWNVAVSGFTITAGTGAATMGLRRLVYVKREAVADGGYVDAAGQRWAVRWGDTVLQNGLANEELGYEAFPGVEAALDEWGMRELTMEEAMAANEISTENK